jgi:hypothetical protein
MFLSVSGKPRQCHKSNHGGTVEEHPVTREPSQFHVKRNFPTRAFESGRNEIDEIDRGVTTHSEQDAADRSGQYGQQVLEAAWSRLGPGLICGDHQWNPEKLLKASLGDQVATLVLTPGRFEP